MHTKLVNLKNKTSPNCIGMCSLHTYCSAHGSLKERIFLTIGFLYLSIYFSHPIKPLSPLVWKENSLLCFCSSELFPRQTTLSTVTILHKEKVAQTRPERRQETRKSGFSLPSASHVGLGAQGTFFGSESPYP